ncbi:MAG: MFS family permease [Candidatus Azotimanducaceae bacterium]|jgi:MFS family permease
MRTGKHQSGFMQLFISKRLVNGAAAALTGLFVPIFLYTTSGGSFLVVGGFYALLSLAYVLLLVPSMQITNRIGFSHALVLGGVFNVGVISSLYFMNVDNVWTLLPFTFVLFVGLRLFHWVPYHVDFAMFTKAGERGRDVSLTFATIAFMGVIGPILAGFIILHAGYAGLFAVTTVLLIAATISYAFVPETAAYFEWSLKETWQKLFSKEARPLVVGEFANGAEVVVTLIAWPIFLFEILDGNVFDIGAISTVIVGVTIVLQLMVGKYLDAKKGSKERTLRVGSTMYAIGWIIKIFVLSTLQIFFVGLYHNIAKIFTQTPFTALIYDMSADQGKYIDEFTVLREMAGHLGRTLSLVIIVIATFYVSIEWTFIIAAIASLALNMVYRISQK